MSSTTPPLRYRSLLDGPPPAPNKRHRRAFDDDEFTLIVLRDLGGWLLPNIDIDEYDRQHLLEGKYVASHRLLQLVGVVPSEEGPVWEVAGERCHDLGQLPRRPKHVYILDVPDAPTRMDAAGADDSGGAAAAALAAIRSGGRTGQSAKAVVELTTEGGDTPVAGDAPEPGPVAVPVEPGPRADGGDPGAAKTAGA